MSRRKANGRERRVFLAALAEGLSASGAARVADLELEPLERLRAADAAFATAWDRAVETGVDLLEDAVLRRARDGVERPVHYQGARVGSLRSYSDSLAALLLKARRPERYRERADVSAELVLRHEDVLDQLD